jgi:DNA ligase (NAD+)
LTKAQTAADGRYMPKKSRVTELEKILVKAQEAYHNGQPIMTDDQYDALFDELEALDPSNPVLKKVGAPIQAGDEVVLPIPLPSLNKAKPGGALGAWLAKNPAASYMVSAKLDGCSALWIPATRSLYTRGDGVRGRDISVFATYFGGFPKVSKGGPVAVRGELIMRTDSPAIPTGKLARNIVAGALNRKEVDVALFKEIRFIAYELVEPATLEPKEATAILKSAGYETAQATIIKAADMTEAHLSAVFDAAELSSPYQMDGIVVAPITARAKAPSGLVNPTDRIAWKQRGQIQSRQTTVREVEWNVSHTGYLIPRVLFDEIEVGGARIHAATGLHGRWIHDNGIGPGAKIEVRRAGDTIPQIIAVHTSVKPAMPAAFEWVSKEDGEPVHIRPTAEADAAPQQKIKLVHAFKELGVEHVGPGLVAKLFDAGFSTVAAAYAAKPEDFAAKVDGCKGKMATKIYEGLRASQSSWTELDILVASSTMPRTVGRTKLAVLLALEPKVDKWAAKLPGQSPPGISPDTIQLVIDALPAYLAWRKENIGAVKVAKAPVAQGRLFVFTGARDKELMDAIEAAGDTIADSVTKKTAAVVYPDGPMPDSSKVVKAQSLGIPVLTAAEFRKQFLA